MISSLVAIVEPCQNPNILRVIYFVKELLSIVFIMVPIGLILMLSVDFGKSVIAKDPDAMKKNLNLVIKRIIFCIALFLVRPITQFTFDTLADVGLESNWVTCYQNATPTKIKKFQTKYDKLVKEEQYDIPEPNFSKPSGLTPSVSQGELLSVAETLWKKLADGNYSYGAASGIPITGTKIDCSAYISWVLYEYGYEEFKGNQQDTLYFLNTDLNEAFGWEEIPVAAGEDVTDILQPGDILVRDTGAGGNKGHINITVKVENGVVYAYDCGGSESWQGSEGKPVDKSYFAKDYRAGKIIRVTKPKSS